MYLTSFPLYSKDRICEGSDMRGSDIRGSTVLCILWRCEYMGQRGHRRCQSRIYTYKAQFDTGTFRDDPFALWRSNAPLHFKCLFNSFYFSSSRLASHVLRPLGPRCTSRFYPGLSVSRILSRLRRFSRVAFS